MLLSSSLEPEQQYVRYFSPFRRWERFTQCLLGYSPRGLPCFDQLVQQYLKMHLSTCFVRCSLKAQQLFLIFSDLFMLISTWFSYPRNTFLLNHRTKVFEGEIAFSSSPGSWNTGLVVGGLLSVFCLMEECSWHKTTKKPQNKTGPAFHRRLFMNH